MRRREFIALLGGAMASAPIAALAQSQGRVRRIGALFGLVADDPEGQRRVVAFRQQLNALGWIDGRNLQVEYRWAGADTALLGAYAAELVRWTPDVILAHSNPGLAALRRETDSIPLVFIQVADPVGSGFIQSLSRPGGNVTGFTNFDLSMGTKWMELLKQVAPSVTRAVVLLHPETPANVAMMRTAEAAAPSFGVTLTAAGVHDAAEIERAIATLAGVPGGGLIVMPHLVTVAHRQLIADLAARQRLPAVYPFRFMAESGGLIAYGIDPVDLTRRAAISIDRILRGAKPGDLPVEEPTKFELVVNLKAAKALGLVIPQSILLQADEVIE